MSKTAFIPDSVGVAAVVLMSLFIARPAFAQDAADWQPIDGYLRTMETRSGTLTIVPGEQCPETREPATYKVIRLGETALFQLGCAFDADYYAVNFRNAFELGEQDVIVLSASAGGSGSPPPRLHLIVLDPAAEPTLERDPDFRSVDGIQQVAQDGNRIRFDLGYVNGERKTASYDGESLRVEYARAESVPVAHARCRAVHSTMFDCMQRGRGKDYSAMSLTDFLNDPGRFSTASHNNLKSLANYPGFSGEGYMQMCSEAAATGVEPDYQDFRDAACTP